VFEIFLFKAHPSLQVEVYNVGFGLHFERMQISEKFLMKLHIKNTKVMKTC